MLEAIMEVDASPAMTAVESEEMERAVEAWVPTVADRCASTVRESSDTALETSEVFDASVRTFVLSERVTPSMAVVSET
jgi:hypothetical protein